MKQKTVLAIVIMAIMLAPLSAQSEDDFEITQNRSNGVTITGYKGSRKDVVIPQTLYGVRVTEIGYKAFSNKGLTSVVLPNSLIIIGDGAFYNNTSEGNPNNLAEVVIPNSVTDIKTYAFQNAGIVKLNLGRGIQNIGEGAFNKNKITELTLPSSLKTIDQWAFTDNQIKSLTIPNGVTRIGRGAFKGNSMETLVIPASLTEWTGRRNDTLYYIIDTVTGIGHIAFEDCPLTRITMPKDIHENVISGIGFEQNFANFYISQNKAAGTYVKNGPIWSRQ